MKLNILLPTDFSDNAWSAAVYAFKLYANEECTFYFLNSTYIKVSMLSNLSNKLLQTMEKEAVRELSDLKALAESSNANANHEFKTLLSSDSIKNAVKRAVDEKNIDVVVMGTKGATGAKEIFFGSNTIHVIKSINKCPVLIVPEEYDYVTPKEIAFPTDFNRAYGANELEPLKHLADLYNAKIRIVHIAEEQQLSTTQEQHLKMLQNYLSNYEFSMHWVPTYANKTTEINDFIKELDVHMLAMVRYKHSFIEGIIKEPIIKKIGFKPIIPFMVIPD